MSFTLPTLLTFGLPLVAIPLLIHLINLRRRRRVPWAAMEFLLQSQKRNKKWIFLKQLLLLLMRTAAVALIAVMLAGPVATSAWARFLGRGVTHHILLIDDSYSMSDRRDWQQVFDQARDAVRAILRQANQQTEGQSVTLLRFSEAERLTAGAGPDVDRQTLTSALLDQIEGMLDQWTPAESTAGPIEALQAAARLPEPATDETRIVYVVSDFRRPQWQEASQLEQLFGAIRSEARQLQLIQCVEQTRPNLAITRLATEAGLRAAGVECWMELSVANYSDAPAAALVEIEQDGNRLPAVEFDEIEPGETATRRFRTVFATAGAHQLAARLESDAVPGDNVRYFAAQIPAILPVLIVDGSQRGDDGNYLRTALSPGGKNLAGWSPQVERPAFLRRHDQLGRFAAVYLLDVPRLDPTEIEALEEYVADGGGVGVFLGPAALPEAYNQQWYREGQGLLPAPLDVPTQLLRPQESSTPDVSVSEHPVFRVFRGQRNSFLAVANVNFYYALRMPWRLPPEGDVAVLARLRNGAPWVLEKQLGEGRVVVQLGKLAPTPTELGPWSNWGLNPVFPVYANELTGYLSSTRRATAELTSGDVVALRFDEEQYEPEVQIVPPSAQGQKPWSLLATPVEGRYTAEAPVRASAGVWTFQLKTRAGETEQRLLAVNLPLGDGDLHHLEQDALEQKLGNVDFLYSRASSLSTGNEQLAGFRLGDAVLWLLVALLFGEQALAAAASYHDRPLRRAAA